MKVLLAAHVGYPWGGISQRYSDLLHSSLPHRIDLAFFESSPNIQSFSKSGAFSALNLANFGRMYVRFLRSLLREQPSIVHIASAYGWSFYKHSLLILSAKLFGKKVILAPHCSISVFIPKSTLPRFWMKFILNRCDGIIVLSSEWLKLSEYVPSPRLILLKNSIALGDYLPLERPAQSANAAVNIIYLGHIGAEKGIIDLVEAVKILAVQDLPDFCFFVYGCICNNFSRNNHSNSI
jgi:glycosyltransferase involved in cell wall biosynthesis